MGLENSKIKFKIYEIINKNENTKNLENILGPGFIWAHGQNLSDIFLPGRSFCATAHK